MLLRTNVADIRVHMDLVDPMARLGGSRALPLFDAHLDRIVHFEINWARVAVDSPFLTRRLVLPRLRCLRMTNTHDEAQSVVHIAAPALQRLLFDSVTSVDWHNLVSPDLLTLDLCSIYVDMPKLLTVLERCKHLHSLRFTDIEIVGMAMGPYLAGSVPPFQDFLPNLRKFECTQRETNWRGMSRVGVGPFIVPFIPWQQLDNGTFHSIYWHNATERFVSVLQGIELTDLSLLLEPQGTSGDYDQYVWHFRETLAHGRSNCERRVRLCGCRSLEELAQLAPYFACLVELRTDVQGLMRPIFWDIAHPFPNVRTLILELSKEPGSPALADTVSWVGAREVPFPRLRDVHVVHLGIGLLYLKQKTVEDFMRSL
ncbi:hypothetical protein EXIGLDRAFT_774431 [Exidia glandulosa HHB12029]|uniref:F-box domain-containing protein n=1 Tax=Exidia glandulosa HHB12029 TaxID=1314781 RepID=A0A165ECP6_EXIGL|nr:hypothetical protein EXIGLDRAFT_774431 [Exidia glandulosa HHB12029]